ncbi:hypothetical protein PM082_008087 [Marasmius tenuissimus]|nr:hypothetical protein PM082_008087 [Marasmius tenuissimus]
MPRAMRNMERHTQLPQLTPLGRGSRVVYDADTIPNSEDASPECLEPLSGGYGNPQLKPQSSDTTELQTPFPHTSPHNTPFRLNLDGARRRTKSKSHPATSGNTPTTRSQALKASPSCPHLAKSVEAVRSTRLPNISVPCTRLVRNLVKNTKSPGSASAKGREPYFEIVTPATFNLTFEGVVGKEDEQGDLGDGSSDGGSVLLIEREVSSSPLRSNAEFPDSPPVPSGPSHTDGYHDATSVGQVEAPLPNPHSRPASPEPLSREESSSSSPVHSVEEPVRTPPPRSAPLLSQPPPRSASLLSQPPPRSASLPSQRTTKSDPTPLDAKPTSAHPASAPPTTTTIPKAPLSSPSLDTTVQRKKPRPLPTPPTRQQAPTRSYTIPLPTRPNVERDLPPIPVS